jgi:anthranilate synthase/aminodeoxychorismate synthase-like glutamine amidotransferase
MKARVLVVDNYDSFTYNLVQAFLTMGAEVTIRYNDEVDGSHLEALGATHLVVSPGPGRPESAGASMAMIEAAVGMVPILGVCLGHQAIAAVFGGVVGSARDLMHGKASDVSHDSRTIFTGLPDPFAAGRYHSLAVESLPPSLEVSARTADGEVMGIRHRDHPIEGVQFHPESVLTPHGDRLLGNFLALRARSRALVVGEVE